MSTEIKTITKKELEAKLAECRKLVEDSKSSEASALLSSILEYKIEGTEQTVQEFLVQATGTIPNGENKSEDDKKCKSSLISNTLYALTGAALTGLLMYIFLGDHDFEISFN